MNLLQVLWKRYRKDQPSQSRHHIRDKIPAFTVCSDLRKTITGFQVQSSRNNDVMSPETKAPTKKIRKAYILIEGFDTYDFCSVARMGVFVCAARMHASQLAQRSGDAAHHIGKSNQGKNHLAVGWLLLLVVVATMFLHQPKN